MVIKPNVSKFSFLIPTGSIINTQAPVFTPTPSSSLKVTTRNYMGLTTSRCWMWWATFSSILNLKSLGSPLYLCPLGPHQESVAIAAAKSLLSCPTLCDPIDGSPPGFPVPEILQARTLEWVAISFSNAWNWKVKVKLLSRVWLLATPWTTAYQAPPSMGFSRQEYWGGEPLPWACSFTLIAVNGHPHTIIIPAIAVYLFISLSPNTQVQP